MSRRLFLAAVAATLAALLLATAYVLRPDVGGDGPRVMRTEGAGGLTFVPNEICAECHADVSARWTGSHHDRAMQVATPTTVLGDFDDTAFTHLGVTSRFFVRDGRFFVNTEGPDGTPTDFEIAYTFGVEPLQQYLIPFEGGRLQSLTIAWDTERGEWFHLYPDERVDPGDALHWTGAYQTWNSMCAECHSTDLRTGFDRDTGTYDTTWAEIDVSCQACHGPGSAHTAWARDEGMPPTDRALSATGLLVAFDAGDPPVRSIAARDVIRGAVRSVSRTRTAGRFSTTSIRRRSGRGSITPTARFSMRCMSTARSYRARCMRPACGAATVTIRTHWSSRRRGTPCVRAVIGRRRPRRSRR